MADVVFNTGLIALAFWGVALFFLFSELSLVAG
jgi:hypothetical protein